MVFINMPAEFMCIAVILELQWKYWAIIKTYSSLK